MQEKEWFAEWFDTPYYHVLYKDRNDDEAAIFIENLISFLELPINSSILDLACGKGRHSVTLNKFGYNVTGVDLSEQSIKEAKRFSKEGLNFAVQDMREPIPGVKFNAILNLFTSFGYFDDLSDNQKVIDAIHEMLLPEGLLVIDFMNAERVVKKLVKQEVKEVDGIEFHIKRNYDGQHIFKTIDFKDNGKNYSFTERVQALKESDFTAMLALRGFKIIRTFGNFDLSSFDEKTSDRLIIIAKKS